MLAAESMLNAEMRSRSTLTMALFLIMGPALVPLLPQSAELPGRESGFGIFIGGHVGDSGLSPATGSLSYSIGGVFDIGFSASQIRDEIGSEESKEQRIALELAGLPVKQGEDIPLSIEVSTGYFAGVVESDALSDQELKRSSAGLDVGIRLMRSIRVTDIFSFRIAMRGAMTFSRIVTDLDHQFNAAEDPPEAERYPEAVSETMFSLGPEVGVFFQFPRDKSVIGASVSVLFEEDEEPSTVTGLHFVVPN
jgi:hypothetical protein